MLRHWAGGLLLAAAALCGVAAQAADDPSVCGAAQSAAQARRTLHFAPYLARADESDVVALPDHLPVQLRSENVHILYELDASACAAAPAAALWVFRVGAPYRIEVDGVPLTLLSANDLARTGVGQSVPRGGPAGVYNGRIPALFALPPGARTVRIALQTLPYIPSGLVMVTMGPTNLLLPVHTEAVSSVVGFADAASGVVLAIGLMALLLWLPRWRDLSLLWLAVACGLWGVRGLIYFDNMVPGQPLLFEQLNAINALLAAVTIAWAVLHLLRPVSRRHIVVMRWATALSLLAFPLAHLAGRGAAGARSLAQATGTGIICWLALQIWQRRRSMPPRHFIAFTSCIAALMAALVHDLMVVAGVLPATSDAYLFWGFVVVLIGFALMSGEYVVMTLNRAERSNEELELRVAQKSAALESSYRLLRDSEQETARSQERERLLRDMHDGMGAQLMTALRGVERGALTPAQVAQSLQDGLDELRMLMDSTDMGHYLPGALATWRNRWDSRLSAAGVQLAWRIDDSLDGIKLANDVALQVMRILQEAATNIVKHSQARGMALDAAVREGQLHIEVTDDGVGLPEAATRPGARGLKNMHYRAAQIGAQLQVTRQAAPLTGSRVWLVVPLDDSA
ncbi:sensor histidine kinase [soil metagenome]